MTAPRIILASASPRRVALLRQLIPDFQIIPSNAPEIEAPHFTAHEIARVNAWRKAKSIARLHPLCLTLGADTVVNVDRSILAKPRDLAEAKRMLTSLQGKTHQVVTGVCLLLPSRQRKRIFTAATQVTFLPLTSTEIETYLASINPLDKAGGYAIQEGAIPIVEKISGSYSNVVGLPLEALEEELKVSSAF